MVKKLVCLSASQCQTVGRVSFVTGDMAVDTSCVSNNSQGHQKTRITLELRTAPELLFGFVRSEQV